MMSASMSINEWSTETTAIYQALESKLERRHCAELAASAISPEAAKLRGYVTITAANASVLAVGYGFADYQRRTPGMLVPQWDVFGKLITAQYKPDDPRKGQRSRPVKYETPDGGRVRVRSSRSMSSSCSSSFLRGSYGKDRTAALLGPKLR
jgi:hypothetical protein